jgi:GAF domain-containing protein
MSERASDQPALTGAADATRACGCELATELRLNLERAGELARVLEQNLHAAGDVTKGPSEEREERILELERRLATAESDVKELASRLVDSEHQGGRLMNLYVATYQLHSMLLPSEVQATIAEIAINLLGAQQFILLLRREEGEGCEIALNVGPDGKPAVLAAPYQGDSYRGGDPMIDATLADGVLRLGPTPESPVLASVPLRVHHEVVGALVLVRLLDHKPILRAEDRDLLDLLSAHAASALFAARLFAAKDRKLRSLESLVKLARGE